MPSQQVPAETDVLVVGYGPVGATLACLLGRYDVRTLVVDKATEILTLPRAIGLDNEAQRILQTAGLGEDAFPKLALSECRMTSPWAGEFARFTLGGVVDGYAKLVTFYQPDLERALRAEAARHASVITALGVELRGLRETEAGVSARLATADGRESELAARYVIGADGASSLVRSLVGQDFEGRSYSEDWLIIDALDAPEPLDHIVFDCRPGGARPHLPAPGNRQRWEFMLGPDERPEEMEKDEKIRELLAPWGRPEDMRIERKAVYRFHARCCERFQVGRVFLAGDAAHITPPFVGQGLVSGLRDAVNLAWRLAWVLRGHAAPEALGSYDTERRPHAKAMIDLARLLGQFIMPRRRLKAIAIHWGVRLLRTIPPLRRFIDEVRMKPRLEYREGLFAKGRGRVRRGAWLAQTWLRSAGGRFVPSDEALGDGLALVGFGVDPRAHLDAGEIEAWRAIGGHVVALATRDQDLAGSDDTYEDVTGELLPGTAPFGWCAVVRPDRTVAHDGPARDAARLVRETRTLLGLPETQAGH